MKKAARHVLSLFVRKGEESFTESALKMLRLLRKLSMTPLLFHRLPRIAIAILAMTRL